jgi:hypothetical protein
MGPNLQAETWAMRDRDIPGGNETRDERWLPDYYIAPLQLHFRLSA